MFPERTVKIELKRCDVAKRNDFKTKKRSTLTEENESCADYPGTKEKVENETALMDTIKSETFNSVIDDSFKNEADYFGKMITESVSGLQGKAVNHLNELRDQNQSDFLQADVSVKTERGVKLVLERCDTDKRNGFRSKQSSALKEENQNYDFPVAVVKVETKAALMDTIAGETSNSVIDDSIQTATDHFGEMVTGSESVLQGKAMTRLNELGDHKQSDFLQAAVSVKTEREVKVVLERCDTDNRNGYGSKHSSASKEENQNYGFPVATVKAENETAFMDTIKGDTFNSDMNNSFETVAEYCGKMITESVRDLQGKAVNHLNELRDHKQFDFLQTVVSVKTEKEVKIVLERCDADKTNSFGSKQSSAPKEENKSCTDFPVAVVKVENKAALMDTIKDENFISVIDDSFKTVADNYSERITDSVIVLQGKAVNHLNEHGDEKLTHFLQADLSIKTEGGEEGSYLRGGPLCYTVADDSFETKSDICEETVVENVNDPQQNILDSPTNLKQFDLSLTNLCVSAKEVKEEEGFITRELVHCTDTDCTFKKETNNHEKLVAENVNNLEENITALMDSIKTVGCIKTEEVREEKLVTNELVCRLPERLDGESDSKSLLKIVKCGGSETSNLQSSINCLSTTIRGGFAKEVVKEEPLKVPQKQITQSKTDSKNDSTKKMYPCAACSYKNSSQSCLKPHLRIHSSEKLYTCEVILHDILSAKFGNEENSKHPLMAHNDVKSFGCRYCTARFVAKSKLLRHLKKHAGMKPFSRVQCSAKFTQDSHLKSHLKKHSSERPFECAHCGARFTRKRSLIRHKIKHSNKSFECAHCGARFTRKSSLIRHIPKHSNKSFECAHCGARFTRKSSLIRHTPKHSDKSLECAHCGARFTRKSSLIRHKIKHSHKSFECAHCGAKFTQKNSLIRHIRKRFDKKNFSTSHCPFKFRFYRHNTKRLYTCADCLSKFRTKKELIMHMVTHSSEKPYSCAHCSMQFKRKQGLRRHLPRHSEEKPYSCEQCLAKFKHKRCLKRHLTTHSQSPSVERLYCCALCSKRFKTKSCVSQHIKHIHLGVKPHACNQCHYRSYNLSDLKRHLQVHAKPYACSQCSYRSYRLRALKRHLQLHTNESHLRVTIV